MLPKAPPGLSASCLEVPFWALPRHDRPDCNKGIQVRKISSKPLLRGPFFPWRSLRATDLAHLVATKIVVAT